MAVDIGEITATIEALTQEYYTISHNLANVSTAGYKRRRNEFVQALAGLEGGVGRGSTGQVAVVEAIDFSQGSLEQTQRPLDIALHGKGFLVVETPNGPLYTRSGSLYANPQGQLVDCQGRLIAGQTGPIVIPAGVELAAVNVAEDGSVGAAGSTFGRLQLVDFGQSEKDLVSAGDGCFQAPVGVNPQPAGSVVVKQGYRESSNVNVMQELVKLIAVSRLYESNMKLLAAGQQNSASILSVAAG
jgi:flagellar basal body rod protein FlgG